MADARQQTEPGARDALGHEARLAPRDDAVELGGNEERRHAQLPEPVPEVDRLDQLDEELDDMAASVSTSIGEQQASARMSCLTESFDRTLAIFADVLRRPAFREEKITLAKRQRMGAIRRRNDNPASVASREMSRLLYGDLSPSAQALLGGSDLTSPVGYLNTQMFAFFLPAVLIVFGVLRGTAALAGEEQDRTLDLLLAQPVHRGSAYVQKAIAVLLGLALLSLATFVPLVVLNGPVGLDLVEHSDTPDRLVGHGSDQIPAGVAEIGFDRRGVAEQIIRLPLARVVADEAVIVVEALDRSGRPIGEWTGLARVPERNIVILAEP